MEKQRNSIQHRRVQHPHPPHQPPYPPPPHVLAAYQAAQNVAHPTLQAMGQMDRHDLDTEDMEQHPFDKLWQSTLKADMNPAERAMEQRVRAAYKWALQWTASSKAKGI